jgi:hypothetical protein
MATFVLQNEGRHLFSHTAAWKLVHLRNKYLAHLKSDRLCGRRYATRDSACGSYDGYMVNYAGRMENIASL